MAFVILRRSTLRFRQIARIGKLIHPTTILHAFSDRFLVGNSSGAAAGTAGSPAAPAPPALCLLYCLDHLRNDQMLTPSSLARSFASTPPVCNRCTAATLKFSSTFFRALLLGIS